MIYTQRRVRRSRMIRRTALLNKVKDAATFVRDFIPEMIAAIGISVVVFYALPLFFGLIAATFK